ncbi:MAG: hypothetical protein LBR60_00220 [Fibrobacter sp.]|jgi:hypothetical protein|nr:hypothetical protein [Fibrobacter sp.]
MTKIKIIAAVLFTSVFCFAQNINANVKSVSVRVNGLPVQYTALRIDTLERCIQNLPAPEALTASTQGRTEYLKRISGTNKNDYVKVWDAKVQLVYQWKYKLHYLLVPQGGLEKQEPIFHEVEGTTPFALEVTSDPQESDFFAFSSPRRYYFDSREAAQNSAVRRAQQKLSELKVLECK